MKPIHSALSAQDLMQQHQVKQLGQQKPKKDQELREVSSDFESLFVTQMMNAMRESVPESDLLPKSNGEKVFRSMLDQEYAKMAAQSGKLGLGQMIYEQLKPQIEK